MKAVVAIGSNLGDRRAAIDYAIDRLKSLLVNPTLSEVIETEPEGVGPQPLFLNAVAVGDTSLDPRELLDALLDIERDFGRTRPAPGAARTLDLDLVLLGDTIVDAPGLQVPHPRFRERFFVLGPLSGVAPEMRDPITGMQAWELLRALLRDETR